MFQNFVPGVYWLAHRQRIAAFDDAFVVRYTAMQEINLNH
jgi:hypothetical protein